MGYMHIVNLYKNQLILSFGRCFAMEKVHGTSTAIHWIDGTLSFHSGGESQNKFESIFNKETLTELFSNLDCKEVSIFGEGYGGKCMKMSDTYGKDLRFIAFDVKIDGKWLNLPEAEEFVKSFGLEFVPYVEIATTKEAIDAERDKPSVVAERRGCGVKKREGIVLVPLVETLDEFGERIKVKHKTDEFAEVTKPQKVEDPSKLEVLSKANEIAEQWVTKQRLDHVLDKLKVEKDMKETNKVIAAMVEDVYREAKGEIIESKEATGAIGKKTVQLFKEYVKKI